MASFGKAEYKIKGLQEERQFTNPHVRFRRVKGRIIPIFNKKRIGQDITKISEGAIVKGSILSASSYAIKKLLLGKKKSKLKKDFSFKSNMFNYSKSDKFSKKAIKSIAKGSLNSLKFGAKHSGKIGIGITALGVLGKMIGDETQMRSPFGKDYFFTKDENQRGS